MLEPRAPEAGNIATLLMMAVFLGESSQRELYELVEFSGFRC